MVGGLLRRRERVVLCEWYEGLVVGRRVRLQLRCAALFGELDIVGGVLEWTLYVSAVASTSAQ
jgi:hypothetical protein